MPVVEAHATAEIEQNDRVVFRDRQDLREPRTDALKRRWIGRPDVLLVGEAFYVMFPENRLQAGKEILIDPAE